jgi:hypothetical protein
MMVQKSVRNTPQSPLLGTFSKNERIQNIIHIYSSFFKSSNSRER